MLQKMRNYAGQIIGGTGLLLLFQCDNPAPTAYKSPIPFELENVGTYLRRMEQLIVQIGFIYKIKGGGKDFDNGININNQPGYDIIFRKRRTTDIGDEPIRVITQLYSASAVTADTADIGVYEVSNNDTTDMKF